MVLTALLFMDRCCHIFSIALYCLNVGVGYYFENQPYLSKMHFLPCACVEFDFIIVFDYNISTGSSPFVFYAEDQPYLCDKFIF